MKRALFAAAVALGLILLAPPPALADGGPVQAVQDTYIGVPGMPYEYAAWNAGRDTVVKLRQRGAGPAVSALRLAGHYGVPGVDYAGTTTGLSADGHTLILAQIPESLPPRTTRLLVLGTAPVAVRAMIDLPGWSTVDAISPDGRWLYLIHYRSANVNDYEVLAYDLIAHRLLAKPIIDPRDRDEAMTGFPISRVMSAGGRWAYTLYIRPSGVPFVHALDTTGRRAVCVDLPSLGNVNTTDGHLTLDPGGATLRIDIDQAHAQINTRTFKVTSGDVRSATAPVRPVSPSRQTSHSRGDVPWGLVVLLIFALGAVATAARCVWSRRRSPYRHASGGATITVIDPRLADRVPGDDEVPVA